MLPDDAVAVWEFKKATAEQKVIETPDLTGLKPADAAKKLADAGLVPTTPADDTAPVGKVADQYPKAKQQVYTGTAVFLRYR